MHIVKSINTSFYSDDENIYLSIIITTESDNAKKRFEEKWTFVTAETDCRPTRLPDFSEQSGPTFALPTNPMLSDFYKKMLPDSLLNFITEATNIRAKQHYASVITQNDKSWSTVR